jgi:hypothetical protein
MYLNSLSPGFERRPIYFEVPEIEGPKQVGSDCDARDQMYRSRGRKLLRRIPRSSRSESSDSGGLMINATPSPTTFLGCAILEAVQGYCTCPSPLPFGHWFCLCATGPIIRYETVGSTRIASPAVSKKSKRTSTKALVSAGR